MEENQDDEIVKFHKLKRKRKKKILLFLVVIFLLISFVLINIYYTLNQEAYIEYTENANITYGVNLIENEFYESNYVGENIDVIANLIKNIDIEFKYNLNLEKDIEYIYDYQIIANMKLKEKNSSNYIYDNQQIHICKDSVEGNLKRLVIIEKMNLSYNDYNSQINKLIEQYKLDNTESNLELVMKLNIINKITGERINKETNVMTINIPLDTKTVEITVNENVTNTKQEMVIEKNNIEKSKKVITIGAAFFIASVITLLILIRYNLQTRSAEKMYESELKKILFDYKSYIQKTNTKIDYKLYKIIKIDSFNELIQMREDVQAPILMYNESNNLKTIFMIIKDDILFTYILSAKDIRIKLIEESKRKKGGMKDEKN